MKYRDEYDDKPTEKEAISVGLAIIQHEWTGEDDFSKGMRLLQNMIKKTPNPALQATPWKGV